ncbi:ATP-binding protein [Streptomyces sp. NBC_01443]|uniref:ATP-binding protein n=1 Tax=Streptomyces sp. NBC_01443 TaxID=2903868 RepID=UPI00225BB711|nr:ATP-binding protein [Streptomyces sp. NBC_01443]MCX4632824.1 ATP-binding protein [Streptomyces sp. NBC_01443]
MIAFTGLMIGPAPIGPQRYRGRYANRPETLRRVRSDVALYLNTWGLEGPVVGDAQSVATELVANAMRHTSSQTIRMSVKRTAWDSVRITVTDSSLKPPVPAAKLGDAVAESGRGLLMVEALARDWGSKIGVTGKQVWADLIAGAAQ